MRSPLTLLPPHTFPLPYCGPFHGLQAFRVNIVQCGLSGCVPSGETLLLQCGVCSADICSAVVLSLGCRKIPAPLCCRKFTLMTGGTRIPCPGGSSFCMQEGLQLAVVGTCAGFVDPYSKILVCFPGSSKTPAVPCVCHVVAVVMLSCKLFVSSSCCGLKDYVKDYLCFRAFKCRWFWFGKQRTVLIYCRKQTEYIFFFPEKEDCIARYRISVQEKKIKLHEFLPL